MDSFAGISVRTLRGRGHSIPVLEVPLVSVHVRTYEYVPTSSPERGVESHHHVWDDTTTKVRSLNGIPATADVDHHDCEAKDFCQSLEVDTPEVELALVQQLPEDAT